MGNTKTTPNQGQAEACPDYPPVQIERGKFGRSYDLVMTSTRLALALHRLEKARAEDNASTPTELIAWEIFQALCDVLEDLGDAAGYELEARVPE